MLLHWGNHSYQQALVFNLHQHVRCYIRYKQLLLRCSSHKIVPHLRQIISVQLVASKLNTWSLLKTPFNIALQECVQRYVERTWISKKKTHVRKFAINTFISKIRFKDYCNCCSHWNYDACLHDYLHNRRLELIPPHSISKNLSLEKLRPTILSPMLLINFCLS